MLIKLLPTKPDNPEIREDMEEVNMIDIEGTRSADTHKSEVYDNSDDDDGGGGMHGQRVGCQQQ